VRLAVSFLSLAFTAEISAETQFSCHPNYWS
jgi:hypothetical protein